MSRTIFPTKSNKSFEEAVDISTIDYAAVEERSKALLKTAAVESDPCQTRTRRPVRTATTEEASVEAPEPKAKLVSVEELFLSGGEGTVRIPDARYLQACVEAEDQDFGKENYEKALAVRSQVRQAMMRQAQALEAQAAEESAEKPSAEESAVSAVTEESDEDHQEKVAECGDETDDTVEASDDKTAETTDDEAEDSEPKEASIDEKRTAVAQRLLDVGFPEQVTDMYADAMFGDAGIPDVIVELAKAEGISRDAKTALFRSVVAALDERDRDRLLEYWSKELGYQDKEWCEDIVKDVDPVVG